MWRIFNDFYIRNKQKIDFLKPWTWKTPFKDLITETRVSITDEVKSLVIRIDIIFIQNDKIEFQGWSELWHENL